MPTLTLPFWLLGVLCLLPLHSHADDVLVAVASNFTQPLKALARDFEQHSGHRVRIASASSGKLYAQIRHGAPFDVFLSADQHKPQQLEQHQLAVPDSRFTYAIGQLLLWTTRPNTQPLELLQSGRYQTLAIANPKLAPYGRAAQQTLTALQQTSQQKPQQPQQPFIPPANTRRVTGENINQTWQFVASGNADLGFVAASQWRMSTQSGGQVWPVPAHYHEPIRQDAVLLRHGQHNPAAQALLRYLRSEAAQQHLQEHGYQTPNQDFSVSNSQGS